MFRVGDTTLRRRYGSESEDGSNVNSQSSFVISSNADEGGKTSFNETFGVTSSGGSGVMSVHSNSSRDRTAEFINTVRSFQVQ